MIILFMLFVSFAYSINPPESGGAIPQKYLDIFEAQKIIGHKSVNSLNNNALSRSNFTEPQSPPSNYNLAVIMIDFSDKSSTITSEEFQEHLFGSNTSGSLIEYFDEISYGKFDLTGEVYGPYTSVLTESEALENTSLFITPVLQNGLCIAVGDFDYNSADPCCHIEDNNCMGDCTDQTSGTCSNNGGSWLDLGNSIYDDINFSDFDNDEDGVVDAIMIVFPGTGADEDGEDSGHILPHMSILRNNEGTAYYSGSFDGVIFSEYVVCPEKGKVGNQYFIRPIGVYAHEFGHTLGLPDLYDRSEEDASEGVGEWCLMGSGSWNGTDGDTPSHMSAWCKYKLGWVDPIILTDTANLELQNIEENDGQIYKIYADGYQWNEYFLLENRQLAGFDSQQNGSGLLIYHIDENQFFGMNDLFGAGINNDNYMHKLVDIEEADGDDDLDNSSNRGDSGDPYPGSSNNNNFNTLTSPDNKNYSGISSSVEFSNIEEENGVITLTASVPSRDGQVLSYDNGIAAAYGYSEVDDYSYAVKFTALQNGYLNKIDVGLYAGQNNLDINIYQSMSQSGGMYNNLFTASYDNLSSGWNVLEIDPVYFYSGQTFYIVLTNKQLSYGYVTDYTFDDYNSNSYIYNSGGGNFTQSTIGNFCIRSRFDEDGTLAAPDIEEIPLAFRIDNAYPNPFNPIVNLSYTVTEPQHMSVKIYDIQGRVIESLTDNFHPPSDYQLKWDAKNFSSGIYFIEYIGAKKSFKQKISLIK